MPLSPLRFVSSIPSSSSSVLVHTLSIFIHLIVIKHGLPSLSRTQGGFASTYTPSHVGEKDNNKSCKRDTDGWKIQVKCDGRPNGCRNCERLQLECVSENGTIAAAAPDDGTHRTAAPSPVSLRKIRTYRSCTACRLSKTKCDGGRPNCARCVVKKLGCVYDGGSTPRWTRNLNRDAAGSGETTTVSGEERESRDGTNMSGTTLNDGAENDSPEGSQTGEAMTSPDMPLPLLARTGVADAPDTLSWYVRLSLLSWDVLTTIKASLAASSFSSAY